MGPTWLVVVVRFDGEASVETFAQEADARAAFELARKVAGRTCYLAPARIEAKS